MWLYQYEAFENADSKIGKLVVYKNIICIIFFFNDLLESFSPSEQPLHCREKLLWKFGRFQNQYKRKYQSDKTIAMTF